MQDKHIFFDLDDTLIKCSEYFYVVEKIVAKKYLEFTDKYTVPEVRKLFDIKQVNNIQKYGFGPDNFKLSLKQVGEDLLGEKFAENNLGEFVDGETSILYGSEIEMIDGAEDTVKYLYEKGYNLHILTKGVEHVQKDRVDRLPIKNYFLDYYIVPRKEQKEYLDILEKTKLSPDECFMVGNSPKGDINEAKKAGLYTVFIPNSETWSPEEETIIEDGPKTYMLNSIREMKEWF